MTTQQPYRAATHRSRTTSAADDSADTYGWDTVFAISFKDINSAIANAKASPKTFTFSKTTDDGKFDISGTFGTWQLTTGGDGHNLWMTVPISQGSLTFSGATHTFTNVSATIQVQLQLLPQPGATDKKGKNDIKLKTAGTKDESTVKVLDLAYEKDPGITVTAFFKLLLEDWFNQNLGDFTHTFATVDLDVQLAQDSTAFQWLMPTHTSYAVIDMGTLEDSVFGMLSMTENREPTRLNHQISPNAIPMYARAGFLISRERFLEKMVRPGVPVLFMGATVDDFYVDDDGASITNNKQLNFQGLKLDDGTIVHPDIKTNNFQITLSEKKFTLTFTDLHFQYTPGIDVYIQFEAECTLGIDKDHHIALKPRKMTHKGTVTTSLNKQLIEIATSIAGVILGAAIGFAIPAGGEVIGEAAAEVGTDVAEATINEVSILIPEDAAEDAIGTVESDADALTTSSEEVTANVEGESSRFSQFKGWLARNSTKIKYAVSGSMIGGIVGGVAGDVPAMLEAAANGNIQKLPTLDSLALTAAKPIVWPNQSQYALTSAQLNHSWQIGCHPGFPD